MATYKLGGKTVSESEFKKTVYGVDSSAFKKAVAKEEEAKDTSNFGTTKGTSKVERADGSTEFFKGDELVKETNASGTNVLRVGVGTSPSGNVKVVSPVTKKEVFEQRRTAEYQQNVKAYNRQVEQLNNINKQNLQSKLDFIQSTENLNAKQFYEQYDVNIKNDGSYNITSKNKPVSSTTPVNSSSVGNASSFNAINNTFEEQKKNAPLRETVSVSPVVDVSNLNFKGVFDDFTLDEEAVVSNLKANSTPDLKTDVNTLEFLSKLKVNRDNVDWFDKELTESNYLFNKLQQADTTTELFINNPDANLQAFEVNKFGLKAQSNIQDFQDKEIVKQVAITAGSFAITAGAGTVISALAQAPKISTALRVGGKALQIGYGASVGVRGYNIVSDYDSSKPSKTALEASNLLGEVGGVVLGAKFLGSKAINPDTYKQTSSRTTKIKTGDIVLFEKGTFLTKGGSVRTTTTRAVIAKDGSGQYKLTVKNTRGKVIKTDEGLFNYKGSNVPSKELSGVYDVSSSTSATSSKTGKQVNSLTQGQVEFLGGDSVKGFNRVSSDLLTTGKGTPINNVEYNRLTNVQTTRFIDGKRVIDLVTSSVGKGLQRPNTAKDLTTVEVTKVVGNRRFNLFEVTPYLLSDAGGFATNSFTGGTGGSGSIVSTKPVVPLNVKSVVGVDKIASLVAVPKFVGGFGGDALAVANTASVVVGVPLFLGKNKPDSNNQLFNKALEIPSSPSKPQDSVLVVNPSKTLDGLQAPSKPQELLDSNTRYKALEDVDSTNKVVADSLTEVNATSLSEPSTQTVVEAGVDVIAEPFADLGTDYIVSTGVDIPIKPFIEIPIKPIVDVPRPSFNRKNSFGFGDYDVEVRRGGKFLKANIKSLSIKEALDVGANIVANTAGATFRVRAKSLSKANSLFSSFTPESSKGSFNRYRSTFKEKKKNLFIERESNRIDTEGEKVDITLKGLAKIKGLQL